ncbi:MAG: hypothetical protein R3200_07720 [Xanthomonadales bacterium]|nr:hypothetical protein [Xanthomonadales bacterium]
MLNFHRPHLAASLASLLFLLSFAAQAVPAFTEDELSAPEGHVLVDWSGSERVGDFELQVKRPGAETFVTVYRGPDTASFRSGLAAGVHTYRVRNTEGESGWSGLLRVEVTYPAQNAALSWVGLGVVVFLATLSALLLGMKRRESR